MQPKHPRASHHVTRGLFNELNGFRELETRLNVMPDPREREEVFQIFAEAFLATRRLVLTNLTQPAIAPPPVVIPGFRGTLPTGADGFVRTTTERIHPYTVRFSPGRAPLSTPSLQPFLKESEGFGHRLLITNANHPLPADRRYPGLYVVRGRDLDRLVPADFQAITRWLKGGGLPTLRHQPPAHLTEVLERVRGTLKMRDRAIFRTWPGLDQSLLSLWLAVGLQGRRTVLVVLPSLPLLRRTFHLWLQEATPATIAPLCLHLDPNPSSRADMPVFEQHDLDFPLVREMDEVRQFLQWRFHGIQALFATASSARRLAEGLGDLPLFDLGLFPDAHRTVAGTDPEGARLLDDGFLPMAQRALMTATPRVWNPRQRDRDGHPRLVHDMYRPELHGPEVTTPALSSGTVREGTKRWRLVVSVVSGDALARPPAPRGPSAIPAAAATDTIPAPRMSVNPATGTNAIPVTGTVANPAAAVSAGATPLNTEARPAVTTALTAAPTEATLPPENDPDLERSLLLWRIALAQAVEALDVKKIVTFHENPTVAKRFATEAQRLPGPGKFQVFHVSGRMPLSEREAQLAYFNRA
ncbi:MAG: hypothetical protein HQL57_10065, partial [Magnetococcales bacterium]|nr:hypothetical protein [Magnetococcales bacterium]